MPLKIIREDITRVHADAIVNTANPEPVVGRGTDMALYLAAGAEEMLAERKKIGAIPPGRAAATGAYRLNARYVIHTVGPEWRGGGFREREILGECYANSLALADSLKCKSAAFPLISAGIYGFPKAEALSVAFSEIGRFLLSHDMTVILAVLDRDAFEMSGRLFSDLEDLVGEKEAAARLRREYGAGANAARGGLPLRPAERGARSFSLDEALGTKEDTFTRRLFRLIDERGLDDVTVYKRANIDRKLFSKIRSDPNYKPSKTTAIAFALALELTLPEAQSLLARAGYTLSHSYLADIVVETCIQKGIFSVLDVNELLFSYDQPLLGS